MMRFNLATKFLSAFLVILTLVMVLSTWLTITRENERLQKDLIDHSKTISELASTILYDELLQNSPIPLPDRIQALIDQMDYSVNVTFYGLSGNQIYTHNDSLRININFTDTIHKGMLDYKLWLEKRSIAFNSQTKNYVFVTVPIITRGVKLSADTKYAFNGLIVITFSKTYVTEQLERVSKAIILLSLLVAAGGGFLAWIVSWFFGKLIRRLSTASEEFQKGNYNFRIDKHSNDELGDLAHSFNEMAAGISGAFYQLEEKTKSLEKVTSQVLQSEARIRSLLENASDSILHLDRNGLIIFSNNRFSGLIGNRQLTNETNFIDLVADEDKPVVKNHFDKLKTGSADASAISFSINTGENEMASVEMTANAFSDHQGEVIQVFLRDITERKHLQEQLVQARRMESIGRLAGGVAHDFNNLLAIIIPNTELIQMRTSDDKVNQYADQVLSASRRAADVVKQLLNFSRQKNAVFKEQSFHELLRNILRMLKELVPDKVSLVTDFQAQTDGMLMDEGQIQQMIINLAIHARDSMPSGGIIRFETRNVKIHRNNQLVEMIVLKVSDTGIGIPQEHLPKIFEPFFNTKKVGEGTGLGLAGVYSVVLQHQGIIDVESVEGKGTTFVILFQAIRIGKTDQNII
ncbi:MAG: PAS domain S-box protein [Bacteroidetes bacterium]|nr:PAS domain S-box protein [Bacteroidota bacterium]